MTYKIKKLKKTDIPSVAHLISANELYQKYDFTYEKASRHLKAALEDDTNELWVAKDKKEVCGIAWIVKKGTFAKSAYLKIIAVDPTKKRMKIGSLLMGEIEKRHLKPHGLFILVTLTNLSARKFYEKLGYSKVGQLPDFVKNGLTEVIYYRNCG